MFGSNTTHKINKRLLKDLHSFSENSIFEKNSSSSDSSSNSEKKPIKSIHNEFNNNKEIIDSEDDFSELDLYLNNPNRNEWPNDAESLSDESSSDESSDDESSYDESNPLTISSLESEDYSEEDPVEEAACLEELEKAKYIKTKLEELHFPENPNAYLKSAIFVLHNKWKKIIDDYEEKLKHITATQIDAVNNNNQNNDQNNNQNIPIVEIDKDKKIFLRPYQVSAIIDLLNGWMNGKLDTVINLPTGAGKTAVLLTLLSLAELGQTIIITPYNNLEEQILEEANFWANDLVAHGKIQQFDSKKPETANAPVVIMTHNGFRLRSNQNKLKPFSFLIIDEVHAFNSALSQQVIQQHQKNGTVVLRVSATPHEYLTDKIYFADTPGLVSCIRRRILSPMRVATFKVEVLEKDKRKLEELTLVKDNATGETDFSQKKLRRRINKKFYNLQFINLYLNAKVRRKRNSRSVERFIGKQMMFICGGIEHAEDMAKLLNELVPLEHPAIIAARDRYVEAQRQKLINENRLAEFNVEEVRKRFKISAAVHSNLGKKEKNERLQAIKAGGILIPTGEKLLTTGMNYPALEFEIRIAPTGSVIVSRQGGGRLSRLDPKNPFKVAYLIEVDWGLSGPVKQIFYSKWLDGRHKCGLRLDTFVDDSQLPKVIIPGAEHLLLNSPLQWDPATKVSLPNKKRKKTETTTVDTSSPSQPKRRRLNDFIVDFELEYKNMLETVEKFKEYFDIAPNVTVNSISFTPANEAQDNVSAVSPKKIALINKNQANKQKLIEDESDALDSVEQQALHSLIAHIEKINAELNSIFDAIVIDTNDDEQLIEMDTANNNVNVLPSSLAVRLKSKLEKKFGKITDEFYRYLTKMQTITQRMYGYNQSESFFHAMNNKNFEKRNENIKDSVAELLQDMKQTREIIASDEFYEIIQERKREKERQRQEKLRQQEKQQQDEINKIQSQSPPPQPTEPLMLPVGSEMMDLEILPEDQLITDADIDQLIAERNAAANGSDLDATSTSTTNNIVNKTGKEEEIDEEIDAHTQKAINDLLITLIRSYVAIRKRHLDTAKRANFYEYRLSLFQRVMPPDKIYDENALKKYSTLSFTQFVHELDENRTNKKLSLLKLPQHPLQLNGLDLGSIDLSYIDFASSQLSAITFYNNDFYEVTGLTPENTNELKITTASNCRSVILSFEQFFLKENVSNKKMLLEEKNLYCKQLIGFYVSNLMSATSQAGNADYHFNYMIAYIILSSPVNVNDHGLIDFYTSQYFRLLMFFLSETEQAKYHPELFKLTDFYFLINLFLGVARPDKIDEYLREENYQYLNNTLLPDWITLTIAVCNNKIYSRLLTLFKNILEKYLTENRKNDITNLNVFIFYMIIANNFILFESDLNSNKFKHLSKFLKSIKSSHASLLPDMIENLNELGVKNQMPITFAVQGFVSALKDKQFEFAFLEEADSENYVPLDIPAISLASLPVFTFSSTNNNNRNNNNNNNNKNIYDLTQEDHANLEKNVTAPSPLPPSSSGFSQSHMALLPPSQRPSHPPNKSHPSPQPSTKTI